METIRWTTATGGGIGNMLLHAARFYGEMGINAADSGLKAGTYVAHTTVAVAFGVAKVIELSVIFYATVGSHLRHHGHKAVQVRPRAIRGRSLCNRAHGTEASPWAATQCRTH